MFGSFFDADCLLKGKIVVVGIDEESLMLYTQLFL